MKPHVCLDCHTVGQPVKLIRGSSPIEFLLHLVWGGALLYACMMVVNAPINRVTEAIFVRRLSWAGILLLVAAIYSLWRNSTKRPGCPQCSGRVVPLDTPVAAELAPDEHAQYMAELQSAPPSGWFSRLMTRWSSR
jgi:hypothetical protein